MIKNGGSVETFLSYINKKLIEDKRIFPSVSIPKKQTITETIEPKKTPQKKSDVSIAKDILEGVPEEVKKYSSKYFTEANNANSQSIFTDQSGNTVVFNKKVSNDTKKAAMLLMED